MLNETLQQLSKEWLDEATIRDMQTKMDEGQLTSEELTLLYLDAIRRKNKELKAVLEINPQALQTACALDEERKEKGARSLLHGIPILLKDNMNTAGGMHTSCGSLAMQDFYAAEDAFLVCKLRQAGAVILGKTNMTEWANFMSDRMTNGWSSRGGQVVNPYGPFDVGGSSSGSAAAIAENMAAVAIGTETSGSIINPSAQNALVGLKPTVGMISRSGIIPLSFTQDTAGPMARTVEDAAITFGIMIGYDEADPITRTAVRFQQVDWLSALQKDALKDVRIGIPRKIFEREISSEQTDLFNQALEQLSQAGAVIKDDIDLGAMEDDLGYDVLLYEFKAALNQYLSRTPETNKIRSLSDIIEYNTNHPDETLRFGQVMLEKVDRTSGTLTEPAYLEALLRNRHLAKETALDKALAENEIDVLVLPQDHGCSFSAAAGYPAITVPSSYTEKGEPFCITFCGPAFSEYDLIGYAYAYEQKVQGRMRPSEIKALSSKESS
ncbi:amidase family protein [Sporosarcina sp. Te-1]|uniref:amidase family protein n=1 Tax=Sporosarcina sp. Te-1 TaxID=2818390 RepID=UPI001A9D662D|nr:amidase family protein [Sporosarcina sp. Te-1]QTD42912.1 amidase [Sporosarcina sp. Te-1]